MNLSVEDLVATLSSSHIGQEALDLAALQAQLAQALFTQSIPTPPSKRHPTSRRASQTQSCNTPICHSNTSSSFTYDQRTEVQWHIDTAAFRTVDEKLGGKEDMGEDERMVEDLLIPSSPMTPMQTSPLFTFPPSISSLSQTSNSNASTSTYPTPPPESSFTSTDPFYLAQAQGLQAYSSSAQPSQHSSFLAHQPQRAEGHGLNHLTSSVISLETHPLIMTASAAYGR